jgi:hypothetical protein
VHLNRKNLNLRDACVLLFHLLHDQYVSAPNQQAEQKIT